MNWISGINRLLIERRTWNSLWRIEILGPNGWPNRELELLGNTFAETLQCQLCSLWAVWVTIFLQRQFVDKTKNRPTLRPEKHTPSVVVLKWTLRQQSTVKIKSSKVNICIRELTEKDLQTPQCLSNTSWTAYELQPKTISTETLNSGGTTKGFLHFFSLQLRTSNSATMSSDILFIFVSSASVIFSSRDFWGLKKFYLTQYLQ